jgi:Domain of unknown function (DUF4340)
MMTQRRVVGLLVAAVVIAALAFALASRSPRNAPTGAGQVVLEGLKPVVNDVTELRIAKGDGTHVTLRKQPASWQVVEREYPADSGKVRKLLLDLSALAVVEEKTSDPASYDRIGVEDVKSAKSTGARVEAVTPKKVYSVIVGRTSGMKSTYVRVSGAAQSFLASPQIMPDANPKQWLAREVVDIPESRIKEVDVKPASGPAYTVARDKKEQTDFTVSNIPKGRELSSAGAGDAVAGELASFTMDDVRRAPAADAAAKPAESATFRTFDGLELQVDGQKDGDNHYVSITPRSIAGDATKETAKDAAKDAAKDGATDTVKDTATEAQTLEARVKGWQYEIPGYKYDGLFKPLEDLLKKPEPKEEKKTAKKPAGARAPAKPKT